MKVWKMKYCFYSNIIKDLNNLEKQKATVKQITQADNNWFTVFYTIEDEIEEENEQQ